MSHAFPKCLGALFLSLTVSGLAQAATPAPKTENGVSYMTGGITEDESRAMRQEAKNWPLTVIFSEGREREYLADVAVNIKDGRGKDILDVVTDGPILSARLPEGRYIVSADWEGRTLKRTVILKRGAPRQMSFNWPTPRRD
jgi:hypothetical protein